MKRKNLFDAFSGFDDLYFTIREFQNSNDNLKDVVQTNSSGYEINYVKDGAYLIFEVPGFNKKNMTVELEGDKIVIEGKRTYFANGQEREKKISQRFTIAKGYTTESIEATIEDGLLTIFIQNYKEPEKKRINLL